VVEFVQDEVSQLRDELEALKRESAGHIRRCAEMQREIDELKRIIGSSSSLPPSATRAAKAS